jgi:glycerophosphoryl diester phosphodiesterase
MIKKRFHYFKYFVLLALLFQLLINSAAFGQQPAQAEYLLIGHRGGIVDSNSAENSKEALENAIVKGYWMIESDLRVTKDGFLITHHDNTLKRSFGIDSAVSEMTWNRIKYLKNLKGYKVLSFEDLLRISKGKIGIMIDNKISGNDTVLFAKVITLLKKYSLYENALMIGTDESTDFFTGKIKLSCTRSQLEANMRKPNYRASDFYLFSDHISKEDADWAKQHNILSVGVLNAWAIKSTDSKQAAEKIAKRLKEAGLTHFQIDSEFDYLFKK